MRILLLIAILIISLSLAGCAWQQHDRCWISKGQYHEAKKLYDKVGSLELVRQTLIDDNWLNGEINQAIYRLKKEYHLDSDIETTGVTIIDRK